MSLEAGQFVAMPRPSAEAGEPQEAPAPYHRREGTTSSAWNVMTAVVEMAEAPGCDEESRHGAVETGTSMLVVAVMRGTLLLRRQGHAQLPELMLYSSSEKWRLAVQPNPL